MPGLTEILFIGALVVLFFGVKHLPALLGSLGKSAKEFKKGVKGEDEERPTRDVSDIKKE